MSSTTQFSFEVSHEDVNSVTWYAITTQCSIRGRRAQFVVHRRFSEFEQLHMEVKGQLGTSFPCSKRMFHSEAVVRPPLSLRLPRPNPHPTPLHAPAPKS